MKKLLIILYFLSSIIAYGQQKYALVIGNSNYINFGSLRNPVNDANDISTVLQNLGFTVDKVLDGNLNQMETATIRLKNRLSEAGNNAYGFFYYAGHGVQVDGQNYLIPANANIPDRTFLRERAFPMQAMLDMLNDAGNSLNIVVLDACRDFPAAWSRSLSRGLSVVTRQPAHSIIVYATSADKVALDGTDRNGLFTSQFLNHLNTPDIEVKDIFNRTGADVIRVSNGEQHPAIYSQFFGTAYLGTRPTVDVPIQPAPTQSPATVHFDKGKIFVEREDWDNAISELDETIRLDPNLAEAYVFRSMAHLRTFNNEQGRMDANQAIRLNPNYALAYYWRGYSYSWGTSSNINYWRALADYTQAITLAPNLIEAYIDRASVYYRTGDYDKSIADSSIAIRLDSNIPEPYDWRGYAYIAKGEYDLAMADFNQVIVLDPNAVEVNGYSGRAIVNERKGDINRAIADLETGKRLNPWNGHFQSEIVRLRQLIR